MLDECNVEAQLWVDMCQWLVSYEYLQGLDPADIIIRNHFDFSNK